MLDLEKELEIQKEKNQNLKELLRLEKENEELENHYNKLWFQKQQSRVVELLNNKKTKEKHLTL
jgi:hypothetical protein